MRDSKLADLMVEYAKHFIRTPYRWGGDDFTSLDCSGLVIECLQAVGKFPEHEDTTANGLYHRFRPNPKNPVIITPGPGCLAFFFKNNRVYHVGICLGRGLYITADGGGSRTISDAVAAEQNAFVKIRPLRKFPVFVDPFEEE